MRLRVQAGKWKPYIYLEFKLPHSKAPFWFWFNLSPIVIGWGDDSSDYALIRAPAISLVSPNL